MFFDPKINSALYLSHILLFNMLNISLSSPKNSAYVLVVWDMITVISPLTSFWMWVICSYTQYIKPSAQIYM